VTLLFGLKNVIYAVKLPHRQKRDNIPVVRVYVTQAIGVFLIEEKREVLKPACLGAVRFKMKVANFAFINVTVHDYTVSRYLDSHNSSSFIVSSGAAPRRPGNHAIPLSPS
jgi:hypothetical protein